MKTVKCTDHQRELLLLAAQGLIYKEIATRLKLHHQTVKEEFRSLKKKLCCKTMAQLVLKAVVKHVISLQEVKRLFEKTEISE